MVVLLKIIKYKKSTNGRYKVYLDNDNVLLLYEEVILKYNLLLKKEITEKELIDIDLCNQEWDVYYVGLKSIKNRFRSEYELRQLLIRREYPIDLVDKACSKLLKQKYLDDRSYTKSYINTMILTSNKGPYKIEKELLEKKIDSSIIEDEISLYKDEIQIEKINKLIEKEIKSNHSRGGVVLKQKIYNDLKNYGYDISLINSCINKYSFENDNYLAEKEYYKLLKKYSRKYSGEELKRKIHEKMYQKGLKYEE